MENTKQTGLEVQLTGENGNIFNLCSIVTRELKINGYYDLAKEIKERLPQCESYDEALRMFMEYVEVN